jgi:hypothetical protein
LLVQEQVRERYGVLEQTTARRAAREEIGRAYGDVDLILMAVACLDAALSCLLNTQALAPKDPRWPMRRAAKRRGAVPAPIPTASVAAQLDRASRARRVRGR